MNILKTLKKNEFMYRIFKIKTFKIFLEVTIQ